MFLKKYLTEDKDKIYIITHYAIKNDDNDDDDDEDKF